MMPRLPILLMLAVLAGQAAADTRLRGTVTDLFGTALPGAKVMLRLERGEEVLHTGPDGSFDHPVRFGERGNITIIAEQPGYQPASAGVRIVQFNPTEDTYHLRLTPLSLVGCPRNPRAVVLGRFHPPLSAPDLNPNPALQSLLEYHFARRMQIREIRARLDPNGPDLLPEVIRCEGAEPAQVSGHRIVDEFGWQSLLWGRISEAPEGFDVDLHIADAGHVFQPPFATTSTAVDLEHPLDAVLSELAQSALLVGIMFNLARSGQCEAAIYVGDVVDELAPDPVPEGAWTEIRDKRLDIGRRCQDQLPHRGLLVGGAP